MPYPNEHACRLRDPGDFQADSFRRTSRTHEGKRYAVIMGRLKGEEELTEQAYRYPSDGWTADEARSHCDTHEGQEFSAASEEKSQPGDVERRTVTVPELRVVESGEGEEARPRIVGYGAVFDQWSEDLGGFRERIRAGAFRKTLGEADVRALFNHDPNYVLGRTKAGTLALAEDEAGLRFEAEPPDTQWARDLLVSIRRGDVAEMSFGFEVMRDKWRRREGEPLERELIEVRLWDVGPVTFPAYPQTSAQVRARVSELQASAPGQEPHPEDDGEEQERRVRLEQMRRRLELAERT